MDRMMGLLGEAKISNDLLLHEVQRLVDALNEARGLGDEMVSLCNQLSPWRNHKSSPASGEEDIEC